MSSELMVEGKDIGKFFRVYKEPHHRLLQGLFRGRKKYYEEFWAVENVSLEVSRGETVGVIGRNGSGKSTLLQMIAGISEPSVGSISVKGKVAAILELGAGFNPEFTGRENVVFSAAIYGLSRQQVSDRISSIIEFADIGEFIDQPIKTYSSGMYVRLAFAIIAHVDADILIIDEALSVGDVFFNQKCMRFLKNFQLNGTLLFVSHDTSAVLSLCDRAIWLEDGELKQQGSAKDVVEQYTLGLRLEESVENNDSSKEMDEDFGEMVDLRRSDPAFGCDLQLFRFNPLKDAQSQNPLARIINAYFEDQSNNKLTGFVGGEIVRLVVELRSYNSIESVIVGFGIKDKLGQTLVGDNTFMTYRENSFRVADGMHFVASFSFRMPVFPNGDYSVDIAVANGTQENHDIQQWLFDAIVFRSENSSSTLGLVGIPMVKIELQTSEVNHAQQL